MGWDAKIISFRRTFNIVDNDEAFDVLTFPHPVEPILVKREKKLIVVTESGETVCWKNFMQRPSIAGFTGAKLIFEPSAVYSADEQNFKFTTTWSRVFVVDSYTLATVLAATNVPPVTPTFTSMP